MKRLILIGGRSWTSNDGGEQLVRTLLRFTGTEIKLAFCIFAQSENEWEQTKKFNVEMLDSFTGNKHLRHETMTYDNFLEISRWADIIYMPGGDPALLKSELAKIQDLSQLWDGKVIAGSSAGADVICEQYVYLQNKTFGEGFGWVPASCIPHWGNYEGYVRDDWQEIREEALMRRPELPVLCIPEGQFVEFAVQ